jgi:hypothetical protein
MLGALEAPPERADTAHASQVPTVACSIAASLVRGKIRLYRRVVSTRRCPATSATGTGPTPRGARLVQKACRTTWADNSTPAVRPGRRSARSIDRVDSRSQAGLRKSGPDPRAAGHVSRSSVSEMDSSDEALKASLADLV